MRKILFGLLFWPCLLQAQRVDRYASPSPPVALITTDTTTLDYPISVIRLNGATSTGSGLSYNWAQLTGPNSAGASRIPGNVTDVLFWGLVTGSYVFQLTIKDSLGRTAVATLPVNILPTRPRTATSINVTINGQSYPIPLQWVKITYSDGTQQ